MYFHSKSNTFGHEPAPGAKLMKPSKDDELRRRVVERALGDGGTGE